MVVSFIGLAGGSAKRAGRARIGVHLGAGCKRRARSARERVRTYAPCHSPNAYRYARAGLPFLPARAGVASRQRNPGPVGAFEQVVPHADSGRFASFGGSVLKPTDI